MGQYVVETIHYKLLNTYSDRTIEPTGNQEYKRIGYKASNNTQNTIRPHHYRQSPHRCPFPFVNANSFFDNFSPFPIFASPSEFFAGIFAIQLGGVMPV